MVSQVSKDQSRGQQEELAEAVIQGELPTMVEIVEVLALVYGRRAWEVVLAYRYSYSPLTHLVR